MWITKYASYLISRHNILSEKKHEAPVHFRKEVNWKLSSFEIWKKKNGNSLSSLNFIFAWNGNISLKINEEHSLAEIM